MKSRRKPLRGEIYYTEYWPYSRLMSWNRSRRQEIHKDYEAEKHNK